MADEAIEKLAGLLARVHEAGMNGGRPSFPPEKRSRAMLIALGLEVGIKPLTIGGINVGHASNPLDLLTRILNNPDIDGFS